MRGLLKIKLENQLLEVLNRGKAGPRKHPRGIHSVTVALRLKVFFYSLGSTMGAMQPSSSID